MSNNLYGNFFKTVQLTYLDLSVKERTIAQILQSMETAFDTMGNMVGNIHGRSSSAYNNTAYINTVHQAIGNIGLISPEEPFNETITGYTDRFTKGNGSKEFLLTLKPIISSAQQLITPMQIVSDDPNEAGAVWVYKSSLKDLKKDTDFTIIGRRLVFYRTIAGNLDVKYDGIYPTFGRQEDGFRPNVIPSPTLVDQGKVKKPKLTRLPSGRIRVKVEASDYNMFGDKKFGKILAPRFSTKLREYIGPASTVAVKTSEDVVAPWIRRHGTKNIVKLPVSNVYVISELEYEIEPTETIDLDNDIIFMAVSNVTLSEMVRDIYHFMKNHSHSSFDQSRPVSHSELSNMVPTSERAGVRYSPSTVPGNDHPQYYHREGYRSEDPGTYNNALIGDVFISSKYNGDTEDNGSFYSNLDGDSFALMFGDANDGQKVFRRKSTSSLVLSSKQNGLEIITPASVQIGKAAFGLKIDGNELYNLFPAAGQTAKFVVQAQQQLTRFQQPNNDFTVNGLADIEVRNIYVAGNIIPLTNSVNIGQPDKRIAAIYTHSLTAGEETVGNPGIPGVATVYTQPVTGASWTIVPNTDPDVEVRGFYTLKILKSAHKAGEYPSVVGHCVNAMGQREQFVFHKVVTLDKNTATGTAAGDIVIYSSQSIAGYIKVF